MIDKFRESLYLKYKEENHKAIEVICKKSTGTISHGLLLKDLYTGSKKYGPGRIQEVCLITEACKNPEWTNVMEIGVGAGISTLSFANALKNRDDCDEIVFQTIDYANSKILPSKITKSRQNNIYELQKLIGLKNWDHSTVGTNQWFKGQDKKSRKFNIAFIDGDHRYAQTKRDWDNLEKLLEEDFIVFFHDLKKRTQGNGYPHTARRAFEQVSIEKYNKLILNTPFRVGVVYPKSNSKTEKWLTNTLEDLHISIRETNPIDCSAAKKNGW